MALLERVTTLIKANLNDLIEKAEHPEKLLKQLLLDMQNQFMQVKTQVAIAIADQHLLEKKQKENATLHREWVRKAEFALAKNEEDLARMALERSITYEMAARNFGQQIEDQSHQVRLLREALHQLEQKMAETKAQTELLLAQHRRARVAMRSGTAMGQEFGHDMAMERVRLRVTDAEATGQVQLAANGSSSEQRLAALERADQVDRLLADLKAHRAGAGSNGVTIDEAHLLP